MGRGLACLTALLLAVFVSGCGSEPEPDTLAPGIAQLVPADGATGVASEPEVQVWFDETIDCATSHDDLMFLNCDGTNYYGSVSCDQAQAMINLGLRNPLPAGAHCQVILEPGVRDAVGNRMSQQTRWFFDVTP
ncbi:MAG: Ig-like domain-containing protein [Deltaproteobacteria bacterium]|nr:Ig-like domain-containing protein [Deltaproteobacteria bacterium]